MMWLWICLCNYYNLSLNLCFLYWLVMLHSPNAFGTTCWVVILFVWSGAIYRSSPAFSGLNSSLENPSGSVAFLFFGCLRTTSRSCIVQSGVIFLCAFWKHCFHKSSLCTWCNYRLSLIWLGFNLSFYISRENCSSALFVVTRFTLASSMAVGGSWYMPCSFFFVCKVCLH